MVSLKAFINLEAGSNCAKILKSSSLILNIIILFPSAIKYSFSEYVEIPSGALSNSDLYCITVDPEIVHNVPVFWVKDPAAIYSCDCATKPEYVYIPDANFEQAFW